MLAGVRPICASIGPRSSPSVAPAPYDVNWPRVRHRLNRCRLAGFKDRREQAARLAGEALKLG